MGVKLFLQANIKSDGQLNMVRKLLYWTIKIFFKVFTRVDARGVENIPEKGGVIIAVNHTGRMEIFLTFIMTNRKDVTGLAAEKYEDIWITRYLIEAIDGIFLDRYNPDYGALKKALVYLKKGWVLGIAPEGTRSPTLSLTEGKQGVAFLAAKSGVPVIPVGIIIPKDTFWQVLKLRRPQIIITFGKAFSLPPLIRKERESQLQSGTEEIMCHIAALLPTDMHGFYAGKSRLKEILRQNR